LVLINRKGILPAVNEGAVCRLGKFNANIIRDQLKRKGRVAKTIMKITKYRTKPYIRGSMIIGIDKSSGYPCIKTMRVTPIWLSNPHQAC
jgi:hypothetical protein